MVKVTHAILKEMKANRNSQFDGYLVDSFIQAYVKKFGTKIDTTAGFIEN